MADMGTAVTTAVTTGASTDRIYLYRSAETDGSRDAYITATNLVSQVLSTLGVVKVQAGQAQRSGVGFVTITFPEEFSSTNYHIVATFAEQTEAFTGGQAIRFDPDDKTTTTCIASVQSTADPGTVKFDWIAVELAS